MESLRKLILTTASLFALSASVGSAAGNDPIVIEGEITANTAAYVEQALRQTRFLTIKVIANNSPGGDIYAAMKIGSMMRVTKAEIEVNGPCYSACAIIYFGAVERKLNGQLGLHRPYLYQEAGNKNPTEEEMQTLYSDVSRYAQLMNIKDSVIQVMLSTPPESMYTLTSETVTKAIPKVDPAYDEWQIASSANRYGVDTATMRSRRAQAEDEAKRYCNEIDQINPECVLPVRNAVLWNLSVEDYEARSQRAKTECTYTTEESRSLAEHYNVVINRALDEMSDEPLSDFLLDPWIVWRHDCWQSIMNGQ